MKKILMIFFLSICSSQTLDLIDIHMKELETSVDNASRSSQRVFVEDFTGLN